jgi:FMN-dependent NADH-azoreductase
MKHTRSDGRQEPEADPYLDETMAMVYVGDVYSLVAQQGSVAEPAKEKIKDKAEKPAPQDDRDALWPFVR